MDVGFLIDKMLLDFRGGGMVESSFENVDVVILDGLLYCGDVVIVIKEDWLKMVW